jgi:hypothetical protein
MNLVRRILALFRKPLGFPLGVHVPADPAEHAVQFALTWQDRLDRYAAVRMEELGVPAERIGSSDHRHGIAWCAFNPYEDSGGGVSTGGRINVDSGVLNPDLMTEPYGKRAARTWQKSRLRDRIDAIIVHELSEAARATHVAALKAAPETELPITDGARRILRAMEKGWKGR